MDNNNPKKSFNPRRGSTTKHFGPRGYGGKKNIPMPRPAAKEGEAAETKPFIMPKEIQPAPPKTDAPKTNAPGTEGAASGERRDNRPRRNRGGRGRGRGERGENRNDNRSENRGEKRPLPAEQSEAALTEEQAPVAASEIAEVTQPAVRAEAPAAEAERDEMVEIVGIRFKQSGKVYYFVPGDAQVKAGMNVIVETARGVEYGTAAIGNKLVELREIVPPLRTVLRVATPEDEAHYLANAEKEKEAMRVCAEKIAEHKLEMKLINVEYTFDNNKLLFYFTADSRIDFRDLVKDLASVFRTRIELRQIGIRDEAKMIGGLGLCGRPFCCKQFLGDFVQVSIKMAKEQNMSLNSAKISGACGRLMCCLRYEYDTYDAEIRRTPKVDSIVATPDGDGVVTEATPLTGMLKVRLSKTPEMPPRPYHRDDVKVKGFAGKEKRGERRDGKEPKENREQKDAREGKEKKEDKE